VSFEAGSALLLLLFVMLQARGAASALALAENLTYGDDDDRYNYSETG